MKLSFYSEKRNKKNVVKNPPDKKNNSVNGWTNE